MLECLICNSLLVEAFEHMQLRYLICRQCFKKAVNQYKTNTFRRVSILGKIIPHTTIKLQKRLLKFKQKQQISGQSIFVVDIVEMYTAAIRQPYELSTELSIDTEDEKQGKKAFDYYLKYSWLKEKLWENYEYIGKESQKYSGVAGSIMGNISHGKSKVSETVNSFKQEFRHLRRETPSFSQIKIGSFLKQKYGRFF